MCPVSAKNPRGATSSVSKHSRSAQNAQHHFLAQFSLNIYNIALNGWSGVAGVSDMYKHEHYDSYSIHPFILYIVYNLV